MLPFEKVLAGRRILVTGHSGFTGSWVCLWLRQAGAIVNGVSLAPNTTPSLFQVARLDDTVSGIEADIVDLRTVKEYVAATQPDAVLHLAAQPLVRLSYRTPIVTFNTNVMGTANVLEAARNTPSVKAVVCVTTDKVYRNNEWPWPYRENDPLGGKDPYSASKAAAEMVIDSYRASYGKSDGSGLAIATARGGNIIGGGDWSEDRLIPDFVRAVINATPLVLRYPNAIRPWQHVLALAQGYLMLLSSLLVDPSKTSKAWNLGPQDPRQFSVGEVIQMLAEHWQRPPLEFQSNALPEANFLALDSSLARNQLKWVAPWDTSKVIVKTATWYRDYYRDPTAARALMEAQLAEWRSDILKEKS